MQATAKEQSIRIQSSGGLSEDQIQQMVRDAESHAAKDKERKAAIEAKNEAETVMYSAEKSLAEYKDKAPARRLPCCNQRAVLWPSSPFSRCMARPLTPGMAAASAVAPQAVPVPSLHASRCLRKGELHTSA